MNELPNKRKPGNVDIGNQIWHKIIFFVFFCQCEPTFETKCDPVIQTAYEQQCKKIIDKGAIRY